MRFRTRAYDELPEDLADDVREADLTCFTAACCKVVVEGRRWWLTRSEDGRLASYANACVRADVGAVYIDRMGTLPEFRGGGLQRRLIACVERWARAGGHARVWTYCAEWNVASANNFLRQGWLLYYPRPGEVDVGPGYVQLHKRLRNV